MYIAHFFEFLSSKTVWWDLLLWWCMSVLIICPSSTSRVLSVLTYVSSLLEKPRLKNAAVKRKNVFAPILELQSTFWGRMLKESQKSQPALTLFAPPGPSPWVLFSLERMEENWRQPSRFRNRTSKDKVLKGPHCFCQIPGVICSPWDLPGIEDASVVSMET